MRAKEDGLTRREGHGALLPRDGHGERKFEASFANATMPELVALIQSIGGKRTHGIFNIASAHGNVVERTPPYRPEVHPMEFIWAMTKGWCATRYEAFVFMEYAQRFRDELIGDDMTKIVDHCDKVAEGMIEGEAALCWATTTPQTPVAQTGGNRMVATGRFPTYKYRGGHAPRRGQQGP